MSVFRCKMCGGTLEINDNETVAVCEYCGTKQTIPKLSDEKRFNLYDRANHFRRNDEFDKAMNLYEQILSEDNTDAEAYWSIVLCRYGIEYVEDPKSHKRIPTVNRAQFTSIYMDEDYKSALKYADDAQRAVYEEEAKAIDDIQKGILEISSKEEPFDVFICYKETDSRGRRTPDSVLANELYHELVEEGFHVFFSRITLEEKLGIAYEPYIFAALNSAKVMVVIGTKPEYFNAVWVKNEWSRYLSLIKNGAKKMLIPAYRDMDPYDLPEEFSHLQAQDMSKLGFMQDLIRGIKKIAQVDENKSAIKEVVGISRGDAYAPTAPLLRRAFMFLEDGSWQDADEYCERVLDREPENAQAYLGKLMAEMRVRKQENLANCGEPFNKNINYNKIIRFADDRLISELQGYIDHINERNENIRKEAAYSAAVDKMNVSDSEAGFKSAAAMFKKIHGFRDADALEAQCIEKAEICHKEEIYAYAKFQMSNAYDIDDYNQIISLFELLHGWRDADEQISLCRTIIERIKEKEQQELERKEEERRRILQQQEEMKRLELENAEKARKAAKRRRKIKVIIALIVIAFGVLAVVYITKILPGQWYNFAMNLYNDGKYTDAIAAFEKIAEYKDSKMQIENCKYNILSAKYGKETTDKVCSANIGDIYTFGSFEQDNDTSNGQEPIDWIILDKNGLSLLLISKQALECSEYYINYTEYQDTMWESSLVRTWLNDSFYNAAFNDEEKKVIQNTVLTNDTNPKYKISSSGSISDKIFLLNIEEAQKYFVSDDARLCKASQYAIARGADVHADSGDCDWWLRTLGENWHCSTCIGNDGSILNDGIAANDASVCVRPALWIRLEIEY